MAVIHNREIGKGWVEEEIFQKSVQAIGIDCEKSTNKQDWYDHIDFILGGRMTVDVKAPKKINVSDKYPSTEFIWIELKNNNGNQGYLDGKATHIVFTIKDEYYMFDRVSLRSYILKQMESRSAKVNFKPKEVLPKEHNLWKIFTRGGDLKDNIILVPFQNLFDNVPYTTIKRITE